MSQQTLETKDLTKAQKLKLEENQPTKLARNTTPSSVKNQHDVTSDDEEEELEMHTISKQTPNFDFEDELDFKVVLHSNPDRPELKTNGSEANHQLDKTLSAKLKIDYEIHKHDITAILQKIKDPKGLMEAFERYQIKNKEITFADIKASNKTKLKRYKDCIYFGEIINSNRHGKGLMVYADGRVYEGEWANDLKHGKGLEILANGNRYEGQFLNGKPEGVGTFLWTNGETYEGEWKNGLKHGSGMWIGMKGESYIGEWKHGKVDGYGVHTWKNGDRYEGELKGFLKHGHGTEKFVNGDFYVGNYVNGKPDGYGEYYWANSCLYKGQFKNGLRHGRGIWKKAPDSSDIYEGEWINDKKCGKGAYTWASGNAYRGEYFNDMRHGDGEMNWVDGSYYKGQWEKGIQHGEGELFVPNKGLQRGIFANNAFLSGERSDLRSDLAQHPSEHVLEKFTQGSASHLSHTVYDTEGNDLTNLKSRGRTADKMQPQMEQKTIANGTGKYHQRNESSLSRRQGVGKLNPLREKSDINSRLDTTGSNYEISNQSKKTGNPIQVWRPSGKYSTQNKSETSFT